MCPHGRAEATRATVWWVVPIINISISRRGAHPFQSVMLSCPLVSMVFPRRPAYKTVASATWAFAYGKMAATCAVSSENAFIRLYLESFLRPDITRWGGGSMCCWCPPSETGSTGGNHVQEGSTSDSSHGCGNSHQITWRLGGELLYLVEVSKFNQKYRRLLSRCRHLVFIHAQQCFRIPSLYEVGGGSSEI